MGDDWVQKSNRSKLKTVASKTVSLILAKNMLQLRRYSTPNNSAIASRFSQILQEKLQNDPSLRNKLNEQEKLEFELKFSHQLNYLKLETLLKYNKHSKQLATEKPWSGTESGHNTSLRMILDLKPKPKQRNLKDGIRLLNAKELSFDYKEAKESPESVVKKHDDNFREMYKERLLGPAMLINPNSPTTTLNMANTMSSAKINATINLATGRFNDENMAKVRGKPLSREHLANATDTNYFVNQMLNKQDVLPPWVENQQNLNSDISNFRKNLDTLLVTHCKLHGITDRDQLKSIFVSKHKNYCIEKIKLINKSIRDYNLQSPSPSFHKMKLLVDEELENCIARTYDHLPRLVEEATKNVVYTNTNQGFLSLFDEQKVVAQRPVEKVHMWASFKQMFKEL